SPTPGTDCGVLDTEVNSKSTVEVAPAQIRVASEPSVFVSDRKFDSKGPGLIHAAVDSGHVFRGARLHEPFAVQLPNSGSRRPRAHCRKFVVDRLSAQRRRK